MQTTPNAVNSKCRQLKMQTTQHFEFLKPHSYDLAQDLLATRATNEHSTAPTAFLDMLIDYILQVRAEVFFAERLCVKACTTS